MPHEDLAIHVAGGVQTIRLKRAAKKNALTGAMYDAMRKALEAAETRDDIAAHVFLGAPGVFCAGNDMGDFLAQSKTLQPGQPRVVPSSNFIRCLPGISKPMIAAVDGLAIGIGVTMLMHCDLVYASPAASFRTPFLDLGLVQEAGTSVIGPRQLGLQRAFELLVLGETWSAERAEASGLVNAVVPASEIEAKAFSAAHALAAKPRSALLAARRLMRGDPADIYRAMDAEGAAYVDLMRSPEAREAFAAFLEKRKPDFAKARAAH